MTERHYDYFVIGAGSGGVRSARIAAGHGAKVGVAEGAALGGTCVNLGCVPKKLLAYGSDYGFHFDDARGYGWDIGDTPSFDWKALIDNKNEEILRLNALYRKTLENAGVDIIPGYARFIDEKTVVVDGQSVTADKFLIGVGGKPRIHPCEGGALMATSDDVFFWPCMPKHVVIIGGGYVAVEFAHIFHGLGAHVTLLYRDALFLRSFDIDIRQSLAEEMQKQGIDLRFNCDVEKVEKSGERFLLHTTQGDTLECDLPMAAVGRIPNLDALGIDNANIQLSSSGFIEVNEQYQTSVSHIYALGDVTETYNLTPVAIKEGHVLADRLYGEQPERSVHYENVATAIFSYPPIATVGLSEEQALEKGYDVVIYTSNFKPMKHTLSGRDERSFMKLVVDHKTDKVLGLHMMGMDAPEMVQGFAVALNCGATKADFDRTMPVHPTGAEEFVTMNNARQ